MTMTTFILKIKTSLEVYKSAMYKYNNNYCKNKQYNEEHQYHTLCIVNINMTGLDTCFKNNNNNKIYIK